METAEIRKGKINWACLKEQCPQNCCGPYKFTGGNIYSLIPSINNSIPILLTEEDVGRLAQCSSITSSAIGATPSGLTYIKTKENGSCAFLKGGLCSIYEFRPALCRAYPFSIDLCEGVIVVSHCPGFGKGWTPVAEIESWLEQLLQFYRWYVERLSEHFKQQKSTLSPSAYADMIMEGLRRIEQGAEGSFDEILEQVKEEIIEPKGYEIPCTTLVENMLSLPDNLQRIYLYLVQNRQGKLEDVASACNVEPHVARERLQELLKSRLIRSRSSSVEREAVYFI